MTYLRNKEFKTHRCLNRLFSLPTLTLSKVVFFCILPLWIYSQQIAEQFQTIDSLLSERNSEDAMAITQSLYSELLLDSLKYTAEINQCHLHFAKSYLLMREQESSLHHAKMAARIATQIEEEVKYHDALAIMAPVFKNSGKLEKADSLNSILLDFYPVRKDSNKWISVLINQANVIKRLNRYDEAIGNLLKAEEISILSNNEPRLKTVQANLCHIFESTQDFEQSLYYGKKTLSHYPENEKSILTALVNRWMGNSYYHLDSFNLGVQYFLKSISIMESIDFSRTHIGENHNYLGDIYVLIGDSQNAARHYSRGYELAWESHKATPSQVYAFSKSLRGLLSLKLEGNSIVIPKDANSKLSELIEYVEEIEDYDAKMEFLNTQRLMARYSGDLKNELTYSEKYLKTKLARHQSIQDDKLQELQVKFDTRQKEIALKEAQEKQVATAKQLRIQRQLKLLLIGLSLVLAGLLFFIVHSFRQNRKIQGLEHRQAIVDKETHISSLKVQIGQLLNRGVELDISVHQINDHLDVELTQRELEILEGLISGKTNKIIADEQFVSINTVKFHLKNIYSKLEVNNRKAVIQKLLSMSLD